MITLVLVFSKTTSTYCSTGILISYDKYHYMMKCAYNYSTAQRNVEMFVKQMT